jgi:3-hydroxybutyryl-CoA dehydrogenase
MLKAGATELEVAFSSETAAQLQELLQLLQLPYQAVPDIPGFISTRIVSLIINEAFLALEEGVSGREEIDTAMKLGTNYPKGPFEWFAAVGPQRVATLLQQLAATHQRYTPAPLLLQTAEHGLPAEH